MKDYDRSGFRAVYVSHSGGKDSQALLSEIMSLKANGILGLNAEIVLVHADLGFMEHEPMHDWIKANSLGLAVEVVKNDLDFFELCRKYKRLPSSRARFCTSELKTKPIMKFIRAHALARGYTVVANATGIRWQESKARSKKHEFSISKMSLKRKGLQVIDWNPIIHWSTDKVFKEIEAIGQVPHRIYSEGFSRLSCAFCVLGKKAEHELSAQRYPEKALALANLERELGKTIRSSKTKLYGIRRVYLDESIQAIKQHRAIERTLSA